MTISYLSKFIGEKVEKHQNYEGLKDLSATNLKKLINGEKMLIHMENKVKDVIQNGDTLYCEISSREYWANIEIVMSDSTKNISCNITIKILKSYEGAELNNYMQKLTIMSWNLSRTIHNKCFYILTSFDVKFNLNSFKLLEEIKTKEGPNNFKKELDGSPSDKVLFDYKMFNEYSDKIYNFKVAATFEAFEEFFVKSIISDSSIIDRCISCTNPYPKVVLNEQQLLMQGPSNFDSNSLSYYYNKDSENSIPKSISPENDILAKEKKVIKQKVSNFIYGFVVVPCLKEKEKKEMIGNASNQEYLNLTCNNKAIIENINRVSSMQEQLLEKNLKFDNLLEKHKNNEKFKNYRNLEMELPRCILHTPCIDITIIKEDLELISPGNVKYFDLKISKLEDLKANQNQFLSQSSSKVIDAREDLPDSCCMLL